MNVALNKIATYLFLIGVFFIPFNSYEGISALGEYSRDSCILFFLLSFLMLLFRGKISIPFRSPIFQLLILFTLIIILSGCVNFSDMSNYYFKKTSGTSRYFRQLISFFISAFILLLTFYSIIKTNNFKTIIFKIRRVIFYSFVIVVLYGVIEYLVIGLKLKEFLAVLNLFEYFPFTSVHLDKWTNRISSVTFESPALATYLISIAGWMFSYILTDKGIKRFIPGVLVVIFAILSGSRAGFFVIILQVVVFIFYLIKDRKFNRLFVKIFLFSVFSFFAVIVFFGRTTGEYVYNEIQSFEIDDAEHSISNKTRFGMQYAVFQVFLENPLKGAGYGLQAFEAKNKYPDWATQNNWEFRLKHLNEEHARFPPTFNLYLRLLAEVGIFGFIIFMLFLFAVIIWCYNKAFVRHDDKTIIALIITISIAGFIFNWLKMDTIRIYGFWLSLAIILTTNSQYKLNENG